MPQGNESSLPAQVTGLSGPTGRENGAQGFGQRPMPWVKKPHRVGGLKGRGSLHRELGRRISRDLSGRWN